MKFLKLARLSALLLLLTTLPSCESLLEPPPAIPTAADDVGPKPMNAAEIAANWANSQYQFMVSTPFTPEEMSFTGPTPVVYHDLLLGRKVGWQIVLGPENTRLCRASEFSSTRLIINRGRIISTVWSDQGFAEPR